jgi:uncharacterized protein (TIGR02646 family)
VEVAKWTKSWVDSTSTSRWAPDRVRLAIVEATKLDTDSHCSYCDRWSEHPSTIDHFKPKARDQFPQLVLSWENLYLCCSSCQQRTAFDPDVLRPDQEDYDFDRYFRWNPTNGHIEARVGIEELRAQQTIDHFGWNDPMRPHNRKRQLVLKEQSGRPREERDYRFLWPVTV